MIVAATEDDIDAIVSIDAMVNPSAWSKAQYLSAVHNKQHFWVIKQGDKVVGFLLWHICAGVAEIYNIAIAPEHQRQHLAQMLLNKMLSICQQGQLESIFLEVRQSNIAAQRLYEKMGFKVIGHRKNYYHLGTGFEDALVMRLLPQ